MIGDKFKMKKILKNNSGTSLLEMVFAVAMFAVVMIIVVSIFQSITEGQRNAIASQNIQESMRFAFEVISKEIRGAKKSNDECEGEFSHSTVYKIFNIGDGSDTGTDLYFKNKKSECVHYYLNNGQLMIDRDSLTNPLPITPSSVSVSNLEFVVTDDDIGAFHSIQPRVTMKMEVKSSDTKVMHEQETILQTTVSARYYE